MYETFENCKAQQNLENFHWIEMNLWVISNKQNKINNAEWPHDSSIKIGLFCFVLFSFWRFVFMNKKGPVGTHPGEGNGTTPVLLPGKPHGWRSLVDCSPWGRWELDTTQWLHFHFSLLCIGEGNGNPLQCSCLENPRDSGAWWAAVYGVAQSRTRLKRLSSSSSSSSSRDPSRLNRIDCCDPLVLSVTGLHR